MGVRLSKVDLCLQNAKIPNKEGVLEAGIVIDAGKIVSISKNSILPEADETIDLDGCLLLPGIVDVHVHFREPGLTHKEDFSTGSKAALAGGVTTICDMPNTSPQTDSLENFIEKKEIAENKSLVDFGLHGMLTDSIEEGNKVLEAGAASLKLYPELEEDSNISKIEDEKSICTVHPEDPFMLQEIDSDEKGSDAFLNSRPGEAEASEISRILSLTSRPHIHFCHVTTQKSLDLISRGKKRNRLTCEVSPHHLLLDKSHLRELGTVSKTYPPLRSEEDRLALLNGLKSGAVNIVATDHAPHTEGEKDRSMTEAPPGIAGVETSLPLLFTLVEKGEISLNRLVEAMCRSPARIFGLYNEEGIPKGRMVPGADADLVALDQNREWKIEGERLHGKTKFTPFEGREVMGKPFLTLVRGEIMYKEGEIVGKGGKGKFVPRQK